jgi:ferredoxin-thioredoxin reductase catalytic subunit
MMKMKPKYKLNPDSAQVEKVERAKQMKKEKFGEEYCPCVIAKLHGPDTICPCKVYREEGICICKLYVE